MTLTRDTIGKALQQAGISDTKRAEDSLLAAQEQDMKPSFKPWRFPAFTLKDHRSDV